MSTENNKRKTILNDKPFQFGLMYKLGLINLLMIALLSLLFFIIAQDIVSTLIIKHGIQLSDSSNVLIFNNLPITIGYFIVFIGFLVLQSVLSIKITHRITGPIVNITRKLNSIREGNLCGKLILRPKDYCQDLADEVDGLRCDLKNRFSNICQNIEELNDLVNNNTNSSIDDASDVEQTIIDKTAQIKKQLDFFQLETSD